MSDQTIQNRRARLTDFHTIRARTMQQLESVRFDFEKVFVTRKFFRWRGVGREGQTCLGGSFNFF